jgi:hypothetical protein
MGLTFDRFWGAAMASTRFIPGESSVASSPDAAALAAGSALLQPKLTPEKGRDSGLAHLWTALRGQTRAFIRAVQAGRMRKARREIALIRSRLNPVDSSNDYRTRTDIVRYY